jgi:hypothetical protein
MWTAQHPSTPSRVSAKNVDLRIATRNEQMVQPATCSLQTEMWMGKYQRSPTLSTACSVPLLSPHFLTPQNDDVLSQDSDSTAYSVPQTLEWKEHFDVEILPPDRYEPHIHATDIEGEFSDGSKILPTDEQKSLNQGQKAPHVEGDSMVFQPAHKDGSSEDLRNSHVIDIPASSSVDNVDNRSPTYFETIGPLKEQLLAVISKVSALETNRPTIMAADYANLHQRIDKLEAEKASFSARHDALFAIRDEDVANLINVRSMLAKERREHEAMRKLRDDDIQNVIELRNKLAQAIWTSSSGSQSDTPNKDKRLEKRQSTPQSNDLWQAAKTAALEQRVLELESANADLRGKLESEMAREVHTADQGVDQAVGGRYLETDAVFEIALRHRERSHAEIEELKSDNKRLREKLDDKDAQMESMKVLLEMQIGLR